MVRMIRTASLALGLVCTLLILPVCALSVTDVAITGASLAQDEALVIVYDRGPEFTTSYGDPDDITGNRGNTVSGDGINVGSLYSGSVDDPEALLLGSLEYVFLLLF